MLIKDFDDLPEFTAGDGCVLREFLHPDRDALALRYSLAHAVVKKGQRTSAHILKTSEVYYILEGAGVMHVDDEKRIVKAGQAIYIPPQARQHIANAGNTDLKFLCIVAPAWRKEDETIV